MGDQIHLTERLGGFGSSADLLCSCFALLLVLGVILIRGSEVEANEEVDGDPSVGKWTYDEL